MIARRPVLFSLLAGAALIAGTIGTPVTAQRITPADLATALTGTWRMNAELSPQFRAAPAGGRGSAGLMDLAPERRAQRPVATSLALQRGGGRGGGGGGGAAPAPPSPREMAGQAAIRGYQQVAETFTLAATADSVTFTDARGERTFVVDNKNHRLDVGQEAEVTTKSRWDGRALKQEFIYGETKVSHTYELARDGNRLEFTLRIDNFSGTPGRQAKGVYDKAE